MAYKLGSRAYVSRHSPDTAETADSDFEPTLYIVILVPAFTFSSFAFTIFGCAIILKFFDHPVPKTRVLRLEPLPVFK